MEDGVWKPKESPAALRSIDGVRPFTIALASGKRLAWDGARWAPVSGESRETGCGIQFGPGEAWLEGQPTLRRQFPTPPPGHVYSVLSVGSTLFAGTANGLFRGDGRDWFRERLPSMLPVNRPNGIAEFQGTYVVGGMDGLFVGKPGSWKQVTDDAIRQVKRIGPDIWVVRGSGALDKLDVANDAFYPDVMTGESRRPWTCSIASMDKCVLFGGMGGWSERDNATREQFPIELSTDVVTAIAGRGDLRWIGTEKSGVLRYGKGAVRQWNPGNGLTDTTVTAFCHTESGMYVGTLHSGLFRIAGDQIARVLGPTERITQLGRWKHALVVGGMSGAWIHRGSEWKPLPTNGEETTSITQTGGHLTVTTAYGIYFLVA